MAGTTARATSEGAGDRSTPDRSWIWHRRFRLAAFVVTEAAVAFLIFGPLRGDEAEAVQGLPGTSFAEIDGRKAPERVEYYTNVDFLFMLLIAVGLVLAMSLRSRSSLSSQLSLVPSVVRRAASPKNWPSLPSSARWKLLGGAATLTYLVADALETWILRDLATSDLATSGNETVLAPARGDVRLMANLHNLKWLAVTVAILVAVSLWGRRTPARADGDRWDGPDTLPEGTDEWAPSDRRLGVSVSGGGVRSASFAFGVIEELRRRGMLTKARYVTSVSGGSYATAALEHANRTGEDPRQATERFRRRLGYLLTSVGKTASALFRVLFGLLLNLTILYLVILVIARPVGWLIGTPQVQEGLRYDGPVVLDVVQDGNDPDVDEADETWRRSDRCGLETPPDSTPVVVLGTSGRTPVDSADDDPATRLEFDVVVPTQCVQIDAPALGDAYFTFPVETTSGLLRIDDGVTTVVRQPQFTPGDATHHIDDDTATTIDIGKLVDLDLPDIDVSSAGSVATEGAGPAELVATPDPIEVRAVNVVELRDELDIDTVHKAIPAVLAVLTIVTWAALGTNWFARKRLERDTRITSWLLGLPWIAAGLFAVSLAVFIVLPWLVKVLPETVSDSLVTGPSADQTAGFSWWPTDLPPLLAWPLLAVGTATRFLTQKRAAAPAAPKSKKRNTVAFLAKVTTFLTRLAVGIVLILLVVATATASMTTGALNGPFGTSGWISPKVPIFGTDWPEDFQVWAFLVFVLLVTRTAFAAGTWSLAPYYRSRLRWAYMNDDPDGGALDGKLHPSGEIVNAEAGYLDGTNAELVICCAGNITGHDRAPAGRRAVSFSASRSWIGGPEIGWMATGDYLDRLGPARQNDVTIAAMTTLSGAAASPAMGKQSLGPIGSVLAIMNVRLGGWLPHPQSVKSLRNEPAVWKHTPGWTYYLREVLRRYRNEGAYLYVSDGGHWENLGLVEALRRGCNHIVAVSAAGDGAYSHSTLAEAVEIARTDLDIDIEIDSVWRMRPVVDDKPAQFISTNRQFIRQAGDDPEIGQVAPTGWSFGTFTRRNITGANRTGTIMLIEATMTADLPMDVQAYAEGHAEFPDVNTGDQFFNNRDYESYRLLGETLLDHALDTPDGQMFATRVAAMP